MTQSATALPHNWHLRFNMTTNLSTERLAKILAETQATINEHNLRQVRGSVEVDARLFEAVLIEAQLHRSGSNRLGIAAAANWVEQQRESYDNEHGWHDPDTGTFEFGNDAQSEYSATLAEIVEGIRALHPNAAPQPAVVHDGWIKCSERMPVDDEFVYIWPRPDFGVELHVGQYCIFHKKGAGWRAQVYESNYGIEWYPIRVTHWMPLPVAPQC
jgi:hypothetical protein